MGEPTEEDFKKLANKLPGLLKTLGHRLKKAKVRKALNGDGVPSTTPCPVCGELFGKRLIFKQVVQACPKCKKQLEDGCVALVSLDGKFWIGKSPAMPADWAGKIKTAPSEMVQKFIDSTKKQ